MSGWLNMLKNNFQGDQVKLPVNFFVILISAEALTHSCSVKEMFWNILQDFIRTVIVVNICKTFIP